MDPGLSAARRKRTPPPRPPQAVPMVSQPLIPRMLMSDSHPTAMPASAGAQFGNCRRFLCLYMTEARKGGNTAQLNACPSRVHLPGLRPSRLFISLLTIRPPPFAWWSPEPPPPQISPEYHVFTTWAECVCVCVFACTFNFQELLLVFAYFLLVVVPKAVLASEFGGQEPHAAISEETDKASTSVTM